MKEKFCKTVNGGKVGVETDSGIGYLRLSIFNCKGERIVVIHMKPKQSRKFRKILKEGEDVWKSGED